MPKSPSSKHISKEQLNRLDNLNKKRIEARRQKVSLKINRKRKPSLEEKSASDDNTRERNVSNNQMVGMVSLLITIITCFFIIGTILFHFSIPSIFYKENSNNNDIIPISSEEYENQQQIQQQQQHNFLSMFRPTTINTMDNNDNYVNNEKSRAINIERIMSKITSINDLSNPNTPQKHALDWIIHHDKRKLQSNSNHLIQRYVLTVIYLSTGGTIINNNNDWTQYGNLNFLSSMHECHWKHKHLKRILGVVSCNEHMYITNLLLSACNLQGKLPSEIGYLSTLETLSLSDNNFIGRIPSTIGYNMKSLEYLALDSNQLTGSIPDELGYLPKIEQMLLQFNAFSGTIPSSICKIRKTVLWNLWTDCNSRNNMILLSCLCCTMCCDGLSSCSI